MAIKRPVLRYHGGKWLLAPWIISLMPPHKIYVELFGGAASVLLRKNTCYAEIYNDLWEEVVNVFRVLRDPDKASRLKELIELTPFSRTELADAKVIHESDSDIERARKSLARSFMGFGSASMNPDYSTSFRSNSKRSGTTPAHDWANWTQWIPYYTQRLRNVTIENHPYQKVIKQHDSEQTLIYADPPYTKSERNTSQDAYTFEFTEQDHVELSNELKECSSMVMISGYRSELYDDLYSDWVRKDKEATTDNPNNNKTESIWINQACQKAWPQLKLL